YQLAPVLVERQRDFHHFAPAVEPVHLPQLETKMVPACLRPIIERVVIEIHAARRKFVQQRLPEMCARTVNERNARAAASAERVAQARSQLDSARPAPDNYDVMEVRHGISDTGVTIYYRRRPGAGKTVE